MLLSGFRVPSLAEIEHIFFLTCAVIGAAEILIRVLGGFMRRSIKEYFKVKKALIEERASLNRERDQAPARPA